MPHLKFSQNFLIAGSLQGSKGVIKYKRRKKVLRVANQHEMLKNLIELNVINVAQAFKKS